MLFQSSDYAEDGVTAVPYPISDGHRIELSITWEGGALLLSIDPGEGLTVEDQSDASWVRMERVEMTDAKSAGFRADRSVLFRFRSTYEGAPVTILRGEIHLDREAA